MTVEGVVEAAVAPGAEVEEAESEEVEVEKPSNGKEKERNKRQQKKKKKKARQSATPLHQIEEKPAKEEDDDVEIEYVVQNDFDFANSPFASFASVFAKFQFPDQNEEPKEEAKEEEVKGKPKEEESSDSEEEEKKETDGDGKISKKKQRRLRRLGIADLKQKSRKPEVVEWVDVTASDPLLLVHLKSYRNSVPVPRHWAQKRKYLQSKRGIEKPPFELPEFIRNTGITELRDAVREKEENMKMKTKMRERVQPKMGKLEIDYQKLHDAFFKFQTKPNLSAYGDLYYEGKEFEVRVKEKKPGNLSADLKAALNIPPGAPPPWLINMQRYGPPPSYPHLKIPGLNAPIPENAQWGYHPGGWGKPPIDEYGNPLYGDVFGASAPPPPPPEATQPVERNPWGELEEEDYESSEESSEGEGEGEDAEGEGAGREGTEEDHDGLATPSGFSSIASGLETPERIELRKDVRRPGDETPEAPKTLYTVIPQQQLAPRDSKAAFMASHTYDLSAVLSKGKAGPEGVHVALDPNEMESLDDDKLKRLFEQQKAQEEKDSEDMSDMVAEHAAQQSKKRKKQADSKTTSSKKSKDFKF